MRIADRGLRNRNVEDSYETEESSVRSNERIQFRCPRSTFRNPRSAIRISPILMSAEAFDRRMTSHRPERT